MRQLLHHAVQARRVGGVGGGGAKEPFRWKNLVNPGMISCVLAIVIYLSGIKLPYILTSSIRMVGSMTGPLAMMLLGSFLLDTDWKSLINQKIIAFIDTIVAECGKEKHAYESCAVPEELFAAIKEIVPPAEMEEAVFTDDKQTREENIRVITEKLEEAFAENEEWLAVLGEAVYQYQKKTVRKMILKDHKRPDGRAIDQIRPLAAEVDLLPRVHGSAMFTRG